MSTVFTKTTTKTIAASQRTQALHEAFDEYEYGFEAHFDEGEALDRFKLEKAKNPTALVVIEDLPCGHFEVNVLKTEREKQAFYRKKFTNIFTEFWKTLST